MNEWWKNAIIYQIYPRSYLDTSNNGIGDLRGITKKINYISSLGVDAVWLSPFFVSPMKDMGYECKNTPLLQIHEENLTYLYLNLIVTRIQTTTTSLTIPSEKRLVLQKRVMITAAMITLFGPSSGITMTLMI